MQIAVFAELLFIDADGERDTERVAVFQRDGRFQPAHVGRKRNMIILRLQQTFQKGKHKFVAAAERYFRTIVRHKFVAGTGAADGVERNMFMQFFRRAPPEIGVRFKLPFVVDQQTFRYRQYDCTVRKFRNHVFGKPVYAETGNARNYGVRARKRRFQFFRFVKLYALRKSFRKFRVAVFLFAGSDDFPIEMRADKAHFMFVFRRRKRKRRAHHSGADDCNDCHIYPPARTAEQKRASPRAND